RRAHLTPLGSRFICRGVMRTFSSTALLALVTAIRILLISKATSAPFLLIIFIWVPPLSSLRASVANRSHYTRYCVFVKCKVQNVVVAVSRQKSTHIPQARLSRALSRNVPVVPLWSKERFVICGGI